MYEIRVEHEFAAAHALSISGAREPVHGHNWRVTLTIVGAQLDDDGLLADFHTIEHALRETCAPFHNANLNDTPPFDRVNPTAELVAKHIADALADQLDDALAPHARVESVTVTEAPRCRATYTRPGNPE
ncbi:MAG: 6-carboxytetrahydropterin synthase [Phycisphaerales bacterium]